MFGCCVQAMGVSDAALSLEHLDPAIGLCIAIGWRCRPYIRAVLMQGVAFVDALDDVLYHSVDRSTKHLPVGARGPQGLLSPRARSTSAGSASAGSLSGAWGPARIHHRTRILMYTHGTPGCSYSHSQKHAHTCKCTRGDAHSPTCTCAHVKYLLSPVLFLNSSFGLAWHLPMHPIPCIPYAKHTLWLTGQSVVVACS